MKIPVIKNAPVLEAQDEGIRPLTLSKISSIAAVAVALAGAIALSSWWTNRPNAQSVLALRPDAALTFLIAGLSLRFLNQKRWVFSLGKFLALLVTVVGLLTWVEHITHLRVASNRVFQFFPPGREATVERMSLTMGLGFFLTGCSLLLIDKKGSRGGRPAHFIALVLCAISGVVLVGFLYQVKILYAPGDYHYLALYAPLLFLLLALGIFFATPDGILMEVVIGPGIGGSVFRRLLPPLVVFVILLSWLRLTGLRAGVYEDDLGTALTVMVHILIFGCLVFGIAISLNRTEAHRQLLERRIHQRTSMLEAANRELEAFAYSVAHDLRAPLRAIDGLSLATLEDYGDKIDESGKVALERIRENAHRMNQLINGLLELSRMSRAEMNPAEIDLSGMAKHIVTELRQREPERQADVEIEEGLLARGDPSLLGAVLENLLSNAWKFSARKPRTRIEFGKRMERAEKVYFVRDNGIGFDMNYIDKLFGPFQRLHTQNDFAGHGIGLATVQRIVQRHGGRIWAESKVGQGATFYFTLPA